MKSRFLNVLPLGVGIGAVIIMAFISLTDTQDERERNDARTAECLPILTEFERIQAVRSDKQTRFEVLLVAQEEGTIPFDSRIVDYEYRAWMIQETELDRRGDILVQDMRLLNCQRPEAE